MSDPTDHTQPFSLDVEAFPLLHPAMDPTLLAFARAALASHGASPCDFAIAQDEKQSLATVAFGEADERTHGSYARQVIVEYGAIVLGGLLLAAFENKRITRVCKRGSRVDYFVGERSGDERWILEAGGTDLEPHARPRREKHIQLRDSFYRRAPHCKDGFVAATRFGSPARSSLDAVPAEES